MYILNMIIRAAKLDVSLYEEVEEAALSTDWTDR